jgi:CRISPR system Cascade subunit CasE
MGAPPPDAPRPPTGGLGVTASSSSRPTADTLFLAAVPVKHRKIRNLCKDPRDRVALHRAVMSLFPSNLPGPDRQRRSAGNILFRLETPPTGTPRLLIQSTIAPIQDIGTSTRDRASDGGISVRDLTPLMTAITQGMHVQFRIVLNPVKAAGKDRRWKRTPIINTPDVPDAITRFGVEQLRRAGLKRVTLTQLPRTELVRAKNVLWTAQYDGHALVANTDMLLATIKSGIGRSKAYGCGLLSIAIV